jgi:hypothetical protein
MTRVATNAYISKCGECKYPYYTYIRYLYKKENTRTIHIRIRIRNTPDATLIKSVAYHYLGYAGKEEEDIGIF